jgi:hypothetical protein
MHLRRLQPNAAWFCGLACCTLVVACSKDSAKEHSSNSADTRNGVSFGRRQIDQMLADRPDMVGILRDDHPIMLWIIDSMNGQRIGQRIYWNANSPKSSFAEHALPYEIYPPHICLSGGTEVSPIDKWAGLVYELFNLENAKAFPELYYKAMEGELDRAGYGKECAKLEYLALQKAKAFFRENPLPNADSGNNPHLIHISQSPATFDEYIAQVSDPKGGFRSPEEYFLKHYDEAIAPLIHSNGETKE